MTEIDEIAHPPSDDEDDYGAVNSDSWDDEEEDNSEDSCSEDLGQFEGKFRTLIDNKVKIVESFCDHKHYVFSFATPPIPPPAIEKLQMTSEPTQFDSADLASTIAVSTIESARDEVTQLRTAREVFVAHKTEAGERLKSEESEVVVRWLYECEETVEAIDTIIDYKNEIICGRENVESPQLFPDRQGEDTDLIMTRLANLSSEEQRRLFCKFFHKVVELRHSSKQLERNSDQLVAENEDMFKCLKHYKRKIKKQEEAYADRMKHLTTNQSGVQPRPNDDTRLHRQRHQTRVEPHSSNQRHRHINNCNGGFYDSVRDRQRNYTPGPEITRELRKITIHNQNSH